MEFMSGLKIKIRSIFLIRLLIRLISFNPRSNLNSGLSRLGITPL